MATTKKKEAGFKAIKAFRDAPEYAVDGQVRRYAIGDDVSHFDAARLKKAMDRNLVEGTLETGTTEE